MLLKRFITLCLIFTLLSGCITTQAKKSEISEEKFLSHTQYTKHTKDNLVSIAGSATVMGSSALLLILAGGGDIAAAESLALIGAATGYGLLAGVGGITILELYRHIASKSK